MTLPGKDEPIPSKGNDDNLEDQEGEETLWRHDIKKGWIRERAVYIYFITNRRVVSGSQVLKLDDVSDYVSVSEERFYGGGVNSVGTHTRGVNARLSSYPGRGRVVGDVIRLPILYPVIMLKRISELMRRICCGTSSNER